MSCLNCFTKNPLWTLKINACQNHERCVRFVFADVKHSISVHVKDDHLMQGGLDAAMDELIKAIKEPT